MNIFDQYGIKEVADVTIYSIHKKEDGSGDVYYVPALYLDTLKVTTVEKTAENTWAQGGLGNSRLISWDYGKTINLTLEDALCTPASLGLCWGGVLSADWKDAHIQHQTGLVNLDCATERISRMEKAFYPRNDTVNAVVSNLLPRDGKEDILLDQSGDPVYLQRSSILDGVNIKGFGYVDSKPYKWHLEIETAVKSIAVVPDRFFSIYGKSYPIKRMQTVGINQPSEAFKYEIIYLRGYDQYTDESPCARIIYHKQAEQGEQTKACTVTEDDVALGYLADADKYPYLKIRVCWDGSIRAYLGAKNVGWDLKRQIEDHVVSEDTAWVEIPQINTDQFRNIDLWVRFDSINALSYYLITKYEDNIFDIGPKVIHNGLEDRGANKSLKPGVAKVVVDPENTSNVQFTVKAGSKIHVKKWQLGTGGLRDEWEEDIILDSAATFTASSGTTLAADEFTLYSILDENDVMLKLAKKYNLSFSTETASGGTAYQFASLETGSISAIVDAGPFTITVDEDADPDMVKEAVGKDYTLDDPSWVGQAEEDNACTPCCKRDNMSRAIWAYINPRTMQSYDDDYWFHQGEPYYKKSLTLSTKQNPLKAQKIFVEQGVFPGMYKIVCETLIRQRETGEDERVQISLPLCKIKSDQTLTLQADGDPTTFKLDVEVATPPNGVPMEITFYEVEKEMKQGCSGSMVAKDGSTKISAK